MPPARALVGYDPDRIDALHRRVSDAAGELDAWYGGDPLAVDARRRVHRVVEALAAWLPALQRVRSDTSMSAWSGMSAWSTGVATGFTGSRPPVDPVDPRDLAARWPELTADQRREALLGLLVTPLPPFGGPGPLAFLDGAADELAVLVDDQGFAAAMFDAVAGSRRGGIAVAPELRPLVEAVAARYGDVLVAGLSGLTRPELLAGAGLDVPFCVDRATASAFLAVLPAPVAASIEARRLLDTDDFVLADSLATAAEVGVDWGEATHFTGEDADHNYEGGGFVVGPDGERYAIVIPTLVTASGVYTDDDLVVPGTPTVADLGGADAGWEVVGYAVGVEGFQADFDVAEQVLIGVMGALDTGLDPLPPDSTLGVIVMSTAGPPRFGSAPLAPPTIGAVPGADGRLKRIGNGIALGRGANNQHDRAYQVVFEAHPDGRRRARVTTFNVGGGDGDFVIHPNHLFLAPDGTLMNQGVSYGHPFVADPPAMATAGASDVAGFYLAGYDFSPFPIPRPAIEPR